jgi:hypothetical protein
MSWAAGSIWAASCGVSGEGRPSAEVMSQAWTAASRAQAAAVVAGRGPCGSGVGTVSMPGATAVQTVVAAAMAGASSSSRLPSRCPDGSNGLSPSAAAASPIGTVVGPAASAAGAWASS